jgi:hypothetical protein
LALLAASGSEAAKSGDEAPGLYFIASCPIQDFTGRFPARLYWLDPEERQLKLLRTVVDSEPGTSLVRPYYEERLVLIQEIGIPEVSEMGGWEQSYELVDMNRPWENRSFRFVFAERDVLPREQFFALPELGNWLAVAQTARDFSSRLEGIHLESFQQSDLAWSSYRHTRVYGRPGGAVAGADTLLLHATPSGSMEVRRGKIRTDLEWPLPDTRSFDPGEIVIFNVNQTDIAALSSGRDRVRRSEEIGSTTFHVQEKSSGQWHEAEFPGAASGVRAFAGPWLAGHAVERGRQGVGSPGFEDRRQEITEGGIPFDWLADKERQYLPGILFIYDVPARRLHRWETGQGDSEVLLVDGDKVYYRVNRRIFRARITEQGLDDHTLLVENDLAPDIHWAFFGPAPPERTN